MPGPLWLTHPGAWMGQSLAFSRAKHNINWLRVTTFNHTDLWHKQNPHSRKHSTPAKRQSLSEVCHTWESMLRESLEMCHTITRPQQTHTVAVNYCIIAVGEAYSYSTQHTVWDNWATFQLDKPKTISTSVSRNVITNCFWHSLCCRFI